MDETTTGLKELQELDLILAETQVKIEEYGPLLDEVEEPALALEQELAATLSRLKEMKTEERRLEHAADDRRVRIKALQERLKTEGKARSD